MEGEVSDPPFSVLRTSRTALKCDTPFPTLGTGGGGRSLLRYRRTYPCGKARMKTREETLRSETPPVTWQDGKHERLGPP